MYLRSFRQLCSRQSFNFIKCYVKGYYTKYSIFEQKSCETEKSLHSTHD